MSNFIFKCFSLLSLAILVSCTTFFPNFYSQPEAGGHYKKNAETNVVGTSVNTDGQEEKVKVTMSGGGQVGLHSMDSNDKSKMSHALDAAPGKATSWTNAGTGIKYTVTPKKKIVIDNNPFCREYEVTADKGSYHHAINEKACVMTDGNWHTI